MSRNSYYRVTDNRIKRKKSQRTNERTNMVIICVTAYHKRLSERTWFAAFATSDNINLFIKDKRTGETRCEEITTEEERKRGQGAYLYSTRARYMASGSSLSDFEYGRQQQIQEPTYNSPTDLHPFLRSEWCTADTHTHPFVGFFFSSISCDNICVCLATFFSASSSSSSSSNYHSKHLIHMLTANVHIFCHSVAHLHHV